MLINVNSPENYKKLETIISKKEPVMVLYHALWCSYCQEFKPTWNDFTKKTTIKTAELESSHSSLANSPEHQVHSYPTLKLFVNGKVIPFEENRSIENINKFIKSHVKSTKSKPKPKPKPKAKPKAKPKK
jgi:thioredoxin-like negative regulator of GroEL